MTVCRVRPLPHGTLWGRYRISPHLINETQQALRAFCAAGRYEGGHEGLCYWAGREHSDLTSLETVLVPSARHERLGVFVSETEFAAVARQARELGLGILAQVHSHPGHDTRHSDGDDDLVVMPFEGMLSLVAPYYGRTVHVITDFSVHQFQDRRWVLCSRESVSSAFEQCTMTIDNSESERERFYLERDSRTSDYLGNDSPASATVSIHISADVCETHAGQLLFLTLVNQLARMHRELRFAVAAPDMELLAPALCGASTLGDEVCNLASRIDPYGKFELDGEGSPPERISIGIGARCRDGLTWYLGFDRSNAQLETKPCPAGNGVSADLRGAGLAATLGAAAATKAALKFDTRPTILSAWNFRSGAEADPGPSEIPPIDIGRGLMIGAGAVAAAAVYWLMQWGNTSSWTIMDHDRVALHNTNRGLLFFPDDAGWPNAPPLSKVACLSPYLENAIAVNSWYDQAPEARQTFDTVLTLANERNVRTIVSSRNDPMQLQATTGQSWLSQLHRHVSGRDDCIRCRMADIHAPQLACGQASTASADRPERPDAALPFLSAASGLMLVSALQQLQLGEFAKGEKNIWNWDFRNSLRMDKAAYCTCRDDCATVLSREARQKIANLTRWANAPWIA